MKSQEHLKMSENHLVPQGLGKGDSHAARDDQNLMEVQLAGETTNVEDTYPLK